MHPRAWTRDMHPRAWTRDVTQTMTLVRIPG